MPGDVRLIQIARILGLDRATLTAESARTAIDAHPAGLAAALFAEAADCDDVTSTESASDYLESRLGELASLVSPAAAAAVRQAFAQQLKVWLEPSPPPVATD